MDWKRMPLVCSAIVLALAGAALADGVILDGLSPRSIGRGGTNIAYADNGAVLLDNPAGAVNIQGCGLVELGVDTMITDFHYSEPRGESASASSGTPLPQISLIRKSCDGQWAYGVGLFVPAGFSETYHLQGPYPLLGPQRYNSYGSLMKVLPGVACRLNDRWSVGASLGVGITHAQLEGPYFLQGPSMFRGTPMLLDLQATGNALVWSVGVQYALSEATTLGLAYQSESRFELFGSTNAAIPLMGQSEFDTRVDITWPRSLGLGVRHELCPHRILSADVLWFNWSSAFDDFGIHLNNPSNPQFPAIYEQFPLDWRDTVSLRLGYEHLLEGGGTLRLGYVYHRTPIPDGTLTPYIQATLEHAFAVGYGWTCAGWNADLAYMFSFGPEQTVGASNFIGGDFDLSVHRAQTHCIAFSLMRRF